MKDFALDRNTGDVLIYNNDIELVNGDDQLRQKVEKLIGTNKGEWFLNKNQGINFNRILGKNVRIEVVKDEILQALKMIDDTFFIDSFEYETEGRKLYVEFTAVNESGKTVRGVQTWE